MKKENGSITIGFLAHIAEELNNPIYLAEIRKADIFVEECAYKLPKEIFEEELEIRKKASEAGILFWPFSLNYLLSRGNFTDELAILLSGTKKIWILEDSPLEIEKAKLTDELNERMLVNFYKGDLEECFKNFEKMLKMRVEQNERRKEKFVEQLVDLHKKYPEKSILTLRGAAHTPEYYELKKRGLRVRRFFPSPSFIYPLQMEIYRKYLFNKQVSDSDMLKYICSFLLTTYLMLSSEDRSCSGYLSSSIRARKIVEKWDENKVLEIAKHVKKKLRYNEKKSLFEATEKACKLIGKYSKF